MRKVRNSERRSFLRCRQQWQWAYVDNLVANKISTPLEFGTLIHSALELRYPPGKVRGPHPVWCWEVVWAEFIASGQELYGTTIDDEYVDMYELGLEMTFNYYNEYGEDAQWEVVQPEMSFQVEVQALDGLMFQVVGQIDAVVRDLRTMKFGLLEHKTIRGLPAGFWFPMEEQPGTYLLFGPAFLEELGVLPSGEVLDFTVYNFLSKHMKDQRPVNALGQSLNKPTRGCPEGEVSKRQPAPLFQREIVHRSQAELGLLWDRWLQQEYEMRMAREGKLAVYKHPHQDCTWDCQFKDMCELHEMGDDSNWEAYRDAMFTGWDPYAAHVVAAQEAAR